MTIPGKNTKKVIGKLYVGVTWAYAGGMGNLLFNHLEDKHQFHVENNFLTLRRRLEIIHIMSPSCASKQNYCVHVYANCRVCGKRLASYIHRQCERLLAITTFDGTSVQNAIAFVGSTDYQYLDNRSLQHPSRYPDS